MINKKEIERYLGYGKNIPDERTTELIEECIRQIEKIAQPRSIYRIFDLKLKEDQIEAAGMKMQSRNLAKNLRGCEKIVFFAATLGNEPDILMNRYSRLQISKAAVLQAVGAAAIEDYCNRCQKKIEEQAAAEGFHVRPRYSPGYGDLSLTYQAEFLRVLEATKKIGIVLSEGGVMIPEKSVTAVMGLSREQTKCHVEGCESCENKNCAYRRQD